MRIRKTLIAAVLLVAMLITSVSAAPAAASEAETAALEKMKKVCENAYLELYYDEAETDIAVRVKATGDIWFSNPVEADSDPVATNYYIGNLKSQLGISYYNESVQMKEMDNYNDCIAFGQFETEFASDGLTVTYTIGQLASKIIIPQVISEARFTGYLEGMESKAAKKVKRNYTLISYAELKEDEKDEMLETYPSLEYQNIYVLKTGTKDYIKEELMGYFSEVGYTAQDMENDSVENGGIPADEKAWFKIPLNYRLDGDSLVATVLSDRITYNESYYLAEVQLLKYFGAAGTGESGYIFVPDGSGALIYLNNGKKRYQNYSASVYGTDLSMEFMNRYASGLNSMYSVKLPVFGMKVGEKAWFAVIEDGDAYAGINAEISGKTNSYNNVFADFTYLQCGSISLDEIIGANSFQMYSEPCTEENYSVRFSFLSGEKADYAGMAECYRNYLINNGVLSGRNASGELPFFAEYIGAIDKTKSFLGIKYTATEALTTFPQALEITKKLQQDGVDNLKVIYSGCFNEGLGSTAPTQLDVVSKLEKSGVDFEDMSEEMQKIGVSLYPRIDFQYVYKDEWFDGYSAHSYAPRYFDNTIVRTGTPIIANGMIAERNINLISPYYLDSVLDDYFDDAKDYEITGILADGITENVYSDYYSESYQDRAQSASSNATALKKLAESYSGGILGENSNAYAFANVKGIINAPADSNRMLIIDEIIPFYEILLHGYIEFAGEAFNMADDYKTACLKSIECGSGVYFKWIYEDNSLVKETDYSYLYSVNYENWYEDAVSFYRKAAEALAGLNNQTITGHEKLQEKVYRVTYENGTTVIVNYSNENVYADGKTVAAKNYCVIK